MKHTPKKRFGQNFLNDNYIINSIIGIINPKLGDNLIEIGPGLGALTKPLLEKLSKLHVIELDRDIISYLKSNFDNNLIIHEGDALKFDFNSIDQMTDELRVVGNLPYNISTPLLFHLTQFSNIKDMHFMLQKEVVERICAKPGSGDYGRLSVMLQYRFDCYKMLDVEAKCFTPPPKVESAIVRLIPKSSELWLDVDERKLNHIVTAAFNKRRKTLRNSLMNIISPETFTMLSIDDTLRAENLSVPEFLKLAAHS